MLNVETIQRKHSTVDRYMIQWSSVPTMFYKWSVKISSKKKNSKRERKSQETQEITKYKMFDCKSIMFI